jgi:flagellar hook-associated protein 2
MAASVDGLISGLSTSDLISQLMKAESTGQTRIKQKITTQQNAISSLQLVNTRLATLKTATASMLDASTWQSVTSSSSSDAVTVSASAGAPTGKLILDMKELAQAGVKTSTVNPTGSIQDHTGLSITAGGTTKAITVTTDTAQGVADAINAADAGVSAALVSTEQGTTVLQLTGTRTGAANDFSVSGLTSPFTTVTAAADAKIGVGTLGAGGYTVTSSTNTFTNLLPNVSITGNRVQSGVTVSVAADPDAIAAKVQAMVVAANGVLSEIKTQSAVAVNATTTSAGRWLPTPRSARWRTTSSARSATAWPTTAASSRSASRPTRPAC